MVVRKGTTELQLYLVTSGNYNVMGISPGLALVH